MVVVAIIITPEQRIRQALIGGTDAFLKDNTVASTQCRALIRVSESGATVTSAQPLRVAQKSDDDNLATGQFLTNGAALNTCHVVEK